MKEALQNSKYARSCCKMNLFSLQNVSCKQIMQYLQHINASTEQTFIRMHMHSVI